jgi:hypothetical protein
MGSMRAARQAELSMTPPCEEDQHAGGGSVAVGPKSRLSLNAAFAAAIRADGVEGFVAGAGIHKIDSPEEGGGGCAGKTNRRQEPGRRGGLWLDRAKPGGRRFGRKRGS